MEAKAFLEAQQAVRADSLLVVVHGHKFTLILWALSCALSLGIKLEHALCTHRLLHFFVQAFGV